METTVRKSVGSVKLGQDATGQPDCVQTDAESTGFYLTAQVVSYCCIIITDICTRLIGISTMNYILID